MSSALQVLYNNCVDYVWPSERPTAEQDPIAVWTEERIQPNCREIENFRKSWRDGKSVADQIDTVINNRHFPFRAFDCLGKPLSFLRYKKF